MKPHRYLLLAALSLPGSAAWAGPAEDALAGNLQKANEAQDERIARLEAKMQNQGLLNLLNQVDAMKTEIARLRGANEELTQQLAVSDKRVKDLFADLDTRIKELANRPAAASESVHLHTTPNLLAPPPAAASADTEAETHAYEAAQSLVKGGKYKEAVVALQAFLKQFPNGTLAANAQYWTGFAHFAMSDFKNSAVSYQQLLKDYPNSAKVPDAMFSLARAQVQLDDLEGARGLLEQLVARYPTSKAAENGKKLLATFK